MSERSQVLDTPGKVIDALGGTSAVAVLFDVGDSAVSLWRRRGFPYWTHGRLSRECADRSLNIDGALVSGRPGERAGVEGGDAA